MTATERVRELLDERGVEYGFVHGYKIFHWDYDGANGKGSVFATEVDGGINIIAYGLTPEQAIAATLGPRKQPPYDELIEALRRDWEIEASWDGLRRFWYVGWTDEHVRRCESVTIDQDWVRDLIERHSDASGGNGRDFHNGAYAAIADELNATLGSCNCSNDCTNGERTRVDLPHFWTHDGTLHIELPKLPESISVRLPDQRDREVRSARTWQYTRDSGTCHITDNGPWGYPYVCSACGASFDPDVNGGEFNYCPNCRRRIEVDDG